jgi:hypothetical protein
MRLRLDAQTLRTMAHDQVNRPEAWRPAPPAAPQSEPEFISEYGRWAWEAADRARGRRTRRDW